MWRWTSYYFILRQILYFHHTVPLWINIWFLKFSRYSLTVLTFRFLKYYFYHPVPLWNNILFLKFCRNCLTVLTFRFLEKKNSSLFDPYYNHHCLFLPFLIANLLCFPIERSGQTDRMQWIIFYFNKTTLYTPIETVPTKSSITTHNTFNYYYIKQITKRTLKTWKKNYRSWFICPDSWIW